MPTITTGSVTPNFDMVDSSPRIAIGTLVSLSDGGQAIYCQALSELSQFAACAIYDNLTAQMLTTTLSATAKRIGVPQQSIPSGYYGWLQIGGRPKVNLAAQCAPNVPLYTTATSGVLDDAVVSTGLVIGTTATVSISNATAVTVLMALGAMVASGDMD